MMGKVPTWRELLGHVIERSQERQRIAHALGINPLSLGRWVNGTSNPRLPKLQMLLDALPQYRSAMLASMIEEFPHFAALLEGNTANEAVQEIPSAFYTRAISAFVQAPRMQRFWTTSNNILQQALGQLAPRGYGVAITLVQCMPPSQGQKVRSLRERIGRATPPWQTNLEQSAIFLGAESLAGSAVMNRRPLVIENREERGNLYPAHWVEWEESAAAYPITLAGAVAGCLLVSCTYPNFFLPARRTLLQNYAELMTVAFEPGDFYAPEIIDLRLMPYYRLQEQHLVQFRQRVSDVMLQSARSGQPLDILQAQAVVWKQLEEEFLELPPTWERKSRKALV